MSDLGDRFEDARSPIAELESMDGEPVDGGRATIPDEFRSAEGDRGSRLREDCRFLLEYVTFGHGLQHLLEVVVVQFLVLYLDVGVLEFGGAGRLRTTPGSVLLWVSATVVFLAILAGLVRRMARRTFAERFYRPIHQLGAVCGYVLASGLSFCFGYVTLLYPTTPGTGPPALLPSVLFTVVFATLIAIGYHDQIDNADHPRTGLITDVTGAWLAALTWVETEPRSYARDRAHEAFLSRTDDLNALLASAKTAEGRRLATDFRDWYGRFDAHSMLSREMVLEGTVGDGHLHSERLESEHEDFRDIRERVSTVSEVSE